MGKTVLLVASLSMAFFTSCEKTPASLEGTVWKTPREPNNINGEPVDGTWIEHVLTFTSDNFTYTVSSWDGTENGGRTETGTYTYEPPIVTITDRYGTTSTGTVDKRTMTIDLRYTPDVIWMGMELEKQ